MDKDTFKQLLQWLDEQSDDWDNEPNEPSKTWKVYVPTKFKPYKSMTYKKIAEVRRRSDAEEIVVAYCDRFNVPRDVIFVTDSDEW